MNFTHRMPDEDYQAVKIVLRENGNIPTTKLIYETVENVEKELEKLTIKNIDILCHEDWLREQDKEREQRDSFRRIMSGFISATITGGMI